MFSVSTVLSWIRWRNAVCRAENRGSSSTNNSTCCPLQASVVSVSFSFIHSPNLCISGRIPHRQRSVRSSVQPQFVSARQCRWGDAGFGQFRCDNGDWSKEGRGRWSCTNDFHRWECEECSGKIHKPVGAFVPHSCPNSLISVCFHCSPINAGRLATGLQSPSRKSSATAILCRNWSFRLTTNSFKTSQNLTRRKIAHRFEREKRHALFLTQYDTLFFCELSFEKSVHSNNSSFQTALHSDWQLCSPPSASPRSGSVQWLCFRFDSKTFIQWWWFIAILGRNATAPVRETCAQALGHLLHLTDEHRKEHILETLVKMLEIKGDKVERRSVCYCQMQRIPAVALQTKRSARHEVLLRSGDCLRFIRPLLQTRCFLPQRPSWRCEFWAVRPY